MGIGGTVYGAFGVLERGDARICMKERISRRGQSVGGREGLVERRREFGKSRKNCTNIHIIARDTQWPRYQRTKPETEHPSSREVNSALESVRKNQSRSQSVDSSTLSIDIEIDFVDRYRDTILRYDCPIDSFISSNANVYCDNCYFVWRLKRINELVNI